jgi:hypothetical protein
MRSGSTRPTDPRQSREALVKELASVWQYGITAAEPANLAHILEHPALHGVGPNKATRKLELVRLCELIATQDMPAGGDHELGKLADMVLALGNYRTIGRQDRYHAAVALVKEWNNIRKGDPEDRSYDDYWDNPVRKRVARQAMRVLLQYLDTYASPAAEPESEARAIPDGMLYKNKYVRTTKEGRQQVRYALQTNYQGRTLTRFVSQSEWETIGFFYDIKTRQRVDVVPVV